MRIKFRNPHRLVGVVLPEPDVVLPEPDVVGARLAVAGAAGITMVALSVSSIAGSGSVDAVVFLRAASPANS